MAQIFLPAEPEDFMVCLDAAGVRGTPEDPLDSSHNPSQSHGRTVTLIPGDSEHHGGLSVRLGTMEVRWSMQFWLRSISQWAW